MLKSEIQHQYWLTKKALQRKLAPHKEEDCIKSADNELDGKIELFKSIDSSCFQLHRVIDHYQERVCILAQEENTLGKFLKEAGKTNATTGKLMSSTGKAISYCGQQRMTVRAPLLRLHHEVETFRARGVADTAETITAMEKERTEYRAALSWMKSASGQLDPDSNKGLEKFRKAQNHVRSSKAKFDRLALDCLQKIDLLAAARCNMFSHALVAYQKAIMQFGTKTSEVFEVTSKTLSNEPQYNFCVLKELTQVPKQIEEFDKKDETVDSDQMLFFQDEYKDESTLEKPEPESTEESKDDGLLISTQDLMEELSTEGNDLLGLNTGNDFGEFVSAQPFMPSQLLLSDLSSFDLKEETNVPLVPSSSNEIKSKNSILELFNKIPIKQFDSAQSSTSKTSPNQNKQKISQKDMSSWFQLFSELDPLANPDAINKIEGGSNNSHAA